MKGTSLEAIVGVGAAGSCDGVDVAFDVRSVGQSSAANQIRAEVIIHEPDLEYIIQART